MDVSCRDRRDWVYRRWKDKIHREEEANGDRRRRSLRIVDLHSTAQNGRLTSPNLRSIEDWCVERCEENLWVVQWSWNSFSERDSTPDFQALSKPNVGDATSSKWIFFVENEIKTPIFELVDRPDSIEEFDRELDIPTKLPKSVRCCCRCS